MTGPEINLDWLVSVDDHLLEPPTVWQSRLPRRYWDQGPRLVADASGEYWLYEGKRVDTTGLSAAAGKKREEFTIEPIRYDEMRPGCYDPVARLEDMDSAGILASLCFPSFTRFCGQIFLEAKDHDLALLCLKAYNDWMLEEWCGAAPGRYLPLMLIPLWSPIEAAREIERCAAKGVHALAFSENPTHLGLPSIHDVAQYWAPVFAAANDAQMVICTHIGSSSNIPVTSSDAPGFVTKAWANSVLPSGTLLDWMFSGLFERFPHLTLALSEGGIGWIPYVLQDAEYTVERHRYWLRSLSLERAGHNTFDHLVRETDVGQLNVREAFRDHVYGCFLQDKHGIRNIDEIGVNNVMVETDYPHSDSTWPNSRSVARAQLAGLDDRDAYKILRGNAERVFRFQPAAPPRMSSALVG
jgi:predicted TIM-barrel fold metal-dependent hydrolase